MAYCATVTQRNCSMIQLSDHPIEPKGCPIYACGGMKRSFYGSKDGSLRALVWGRYGLSTRGFFCKGCRLVILVGGILSAGLAPRVRGKVFRPFKGKCLPH